MHIDIILKRIFALLLLAVSSVCWMEAKAQMLTLASYQAQEPLYAQDDQSVPLTEVLIKLKDQRKARFVYESSLLKGKLIAASIDYNQNTDDILSAILPEVGLTFQRLRHNTFSIVSLARRQSGAVSLEAVDTQKVHATQGTALEAAELFRAIEPISRKWEAPTPPDITVSGTVRDENGDPLVGATVREKNGLKGDLTDSDGAYRLTLADENATLVFSFVGYGSKEIPVNGRTTIDIALEPSNTSLDEVVVTGYGSQVKRDVTGSISRVEGEQLSAFQAPSLDQQLQGLAAGVQVSATSGVPGSPVRVMVRGTNSLFSGTEPLWIIDGMILSNQGGGELTGFSRNSSTTPLNPLALLNPNDIESIEVLKDAAATAIYGSRGSNGVIIVTTKTGRTGRGGINVDLSYGITDVLRGPDEIGFVDGPTWLQLADEARLNRGLPVFEPNDILNSDRDSTAFLDRSQIANVNWPDAALRQGEFWDINVSASRSMNKLSYYLSGQYREDESILVSNRLRRVSTRANLDFDPVENLTISTRISLSYTDNQRAPNGGAPGGNSNIARGGYNMSNEGAIPILPVFHPTLTDAGGNPILFDPLSGRNLVATLDRANYINDVETYRALGGIQLEYRLPFVQGLSIRTEWAADIIQTNNIEWGNTVIREDSKYGFDFSSTFQRFNYNLFATYNRAFGDHSINLVTGVESTEQAERARNIEAQQLFGTAQEIGSPGDIQRVSAGFGGEVYFRGIFARANYKFKDRYLLGGSFRRDGSSIFAEENRWGNFLAASAGWILSEEGFLRDNSVLTFLKVRGSFGQTGNSAIPNVATQTSYATWGRYGDTGAGDLLSTIGNEAITWETTDSYDIGVEYEILEGRISGSAAYYRQDVRDMLFQVPIPASSGIFSSNPRIWQNIGDMRNSGFEFDINVNVLNRGGWVWNIGGNLTTNDNEVVSLSGEEDEIYNVRSNGLVTEVGEAIGYFRLADYAGIDQEGGYELIYEMDLSRFEETGERVRTGNVIPATRSNLQQHLFDFKDKTGLPTFFGGFNTDVSFRGIELAAIFSFQGGNYIYDIAERGAVMVNGAKQFRQELVGNYWTPDNRNAEFPALSWNDRYDVINEDGTITENERFDNQRSGQVHDKYLYRGDFVRLRSLRLAYNLPQVWVQQLNMSNVRVGVTANNLWTITDFEGYDPEVVDLGGNRNLGQGWVGVQIPQVKSYNFNLSFSF